MRRYLNWFAALNLIGKDEMGAMLSGYKGDKTSTCLLRTVLDDAACENLFFAGGALREEVYYREFGRAALRALLDPESDEISLARYRFLTDPATWAHAVKMGPSPELRQLIPMDRSNPRFDQVLADVRGDLYDIVWWAESMTQAGAALQGMRQFLKGPRSGGFEGRSRVPGQARRATEANDGRGGEEPGAVRGALGHGHALLVGGFAGGRVGQIAGRRVERGEALGLRLQHGAEPPHPFI